MAHFMSYLFDLPGWISMTPLETELPCSYFGISISGSTTTAMAMDTFG